MRAGHRIEAICRSSLRSICRSWIGRVASCGRGAAGRFPAGFRRSWTDWASIASAGWRQCATLADGSSERRADATRWRPRQCAAVGAGSRASAPRGLPFSRCSLDAERLKTGRNITRNEVDPARRTNDERSRSFRSESIPGRLERRAVPARLGHVAGTIEGSVRWTSNR